jgi:hypothetical protein
MPLELRISSMREIREGGCRTQDKLNRYAMASVVARLCRRNNAEELATRSSFSDALTLSVHTKTLMTNQVPL